MIKEKFDQYIRSVHLRKDENPLQNEYPFNIPAVSNLTSLDLHPNVTFIIGENGSGKSTLLEAIAVAYGFNAEGGSKNFNFATKTTHSILHEFIEITKGFKKVSTGYFLRAESFYNVASVVDTLGEDIIENYGGSLHNQSHGESFLSLVKNRFKPKGLYILDEPEAALSPSRQMALIALIHDLVEHDAQFIIATHSPIIMAYPHGIIYDIGKGYNPVSYTETDHYRITKHFLNQTDAMMSLLIK